MLILKELKIKKDQEMIMMIEQIESEPIFSVLPCFEMIANDKLKD